MKQDPNLDRISREVLPQVVRRLDPSGRIFPARRTTVPRFSRRAAMACGNRPSSICGAIAINTSTSISTNPAAHFVSEVGYHGCTDRGLWNAFSTPDHLWPWRTTISGSLMPPFRTRTKPIATAIASL